MILPKGYGAKITTKMGRFILNNYPKLSTNEIAKKIGISSFPVSKFLKQNNITIMPLGYFMKNKVSKNRLFFGKQEKNIIKLYNSGKNMEEISKIFKCRPGVIRDTLIRCKIKRRELSDVLNRGTKTKTKEGYILVCAKLIDRKFVTRKNGVISEHRLVMAKSLNRPLLSTETVDHKNGVRNDNRLENLELYSTAHGAGQDIQHTIQRSIDDILRLGNEYLTGKHGKVKMNIKYKKQLKQMLGY